MARVTYSLDDETVVTIRRTASRLGKPQSHVVRDAVAEFAARADRLSEAERVRAMAILERLRGTRPARSVAEVDAEVRSLRAARRARGRRHPAA